ncbi:MAG TPA: type II secretion system protein GspG [Candidatus Krumholzibacteria bacterium]|nr:type II secretion system protein GspG [Candidatus Krumholzibacteria bacterium]
MFLYVRQGFTRLETALGLCVVCAALVVAAPMLWRGIGQDRPRQAVQTAQELATAIIDYRADTGRWPAAGTVGPVNLALLTEAPGRGAATASAPLAGAFAAPDRNASRPWLNAIPVDPWGRPYRVRLTTDIDGSPAVAVVSAGPDGVFQTPAGGSPRGFAADDVGIVLIDQTDGGSRP